MTSNFSPSRLALAPALAVLLVSVFSTVCRADTEESRYKLGPWVSGLAVGPGMNAVGVNLSGSEFVGMNLSGANFDGCDLYNVTFYQCDLANASFNDTSMTGCYVGDCNWRGARFGDAVINGVRAVNPQHHFRLTESQIKATQSYKTKNLSQCLIYGYEEGGQLRRFDFSGAKLRNAVLQGGDFTACDFSGADISDAAFRACKIASGQLAVTSNFEQGWATGIVFDCKIEGRPDFSGMKLTGSRFPSPMFDAKFNDAEVGECFFGASVTEEQLRVTRSYRNGDMSGVAFLRIDFSGSDLSRQNLTHCLFSNCDFTGCDMADAVITGVRFTDHRYGPTRGLTVEQVKSTWNYRHHRMNAIALPEELAEALRIEPRGD